MNSVSLTNQLTSSCHLDEKNALSAKGKKITNRLCISSAPPILPRSKAVFITTTLNVNTFSSVALIFYQHDFERIKLLRMQYMCVQVFYIRII